MGFFKKKTTKERVDEMLAAGQTQSAIGLCREACAVAGASAQEWLLYGCLCADTGALATARTALARAAELDPALAEAHLGLGKVLATVGEYQEALDRLLRAAELQPDNAEIWLALGIVSGVTQQIAKAEEYCRRSVELQPGSAPARFNLANAFQAQGQLAEAEVEYEAALKLEPGMLAGWSMLAQARVGLHKFAEAKVAASRALTLAPQMGEAYFTLGVIAEALGESEQAREQFSLATELLPNLPDAHLRLGQVLFSRGDYAGTIQSLQSAVNLNPALIDAHFIMGQCFNGLDLHEGAVNCYRRVVELNHDHLRAHYSIALLLASLDRYAEAAAHLAEVLRINPADDQARHLLASYRGQTTATAPAAYVSTLFDGIADTFDEKLVDELGYHVPEFMHDMVSQLAMPAAGSLDVIDLGCGTGLCAPLFRGMARTLHGVDLSPRMIDKARERTLYDTLEINDVVSSLNSRQAAWDLAISTDVFIYVGDLREVFKAGSTALRAGGIFAFSIEAGDDADAFILRPSGRYAHASSYIRELAAQAGFSEIERRAVVVRKENRVDINGYLFVLQRMAELPAGNPV